MAKTLIDIDDELLRQAMKLTGASTKKATVNEALALVVRRNEAIRYVELLRGRVAADLDDPQVVKDAQR